MKTNDIVTTTFIQPELSIPVTAEISAVTSTIITSAEVIEISDSTTKHNGYRFQLPKEIIDTYFYSNDIETKIDLKWIGHDPAGYWYMGDESYCIVDVSDNEYTNFLYTECNESLPNEIVDDMFQYKLETEWSKNLTIVGMGYMLFDLNDDGYDDYIIAEGVSGDGYMTSYLYKIYIYSDKGIYIPIKWSCLKQFNDIQYILKTKTNGLHDIMVLYNANYPVITYEGGDSYTPCEMLDERHTFLNAEILFENVLHINMKISSIDADKGEYYTAIKFADNQYLTNNLLYSCYPDGKPHSYIKKPYGDDERIEFNPSQEGYDFYVELTDEGVVAFAEEDNVWRLLELLEIKYIAADKNNT